MQKQVEGLTNSDPKKSNDSNFENSTRKNNRKKVIEEKGSSAKLTGALAKHLLEGKYPEKWVRSKLPEYKGTTDPETHIVKFIANMEDVTDRQDLWCRMFIRTLVGEIMNWYADLPAGCIHSFNDLRNKFVETFGHRIKRKLDIGLLLNVKQGPSENLKGYITRFNEALIKVTKPSDEATIMALRAGLHPTCFLLKIIDDPPTSLSEMMERTYKEMNSEDTMDQRIKEEMTWNMPIKGGNPHSNQKKLFCELKSKGILSSPRPMDDRTQQSRNNGKFCKYYQDQGHTTKECRSLAKEIERHQPVEKLPDPPRTQQNLKGTVFMILGRENNKRKEASSEILSINKKDRKKEIIYFSEDDLSDIKFPHQDPLLYHKSLTNS